MEDIDLKFWVTIASIIFAAGGIYTKLGSVEKTIEKIQLTLFGEDGRNGLVGDVRSAKEHVDECKKNSWHMPKFSNHIMAHNEDVVVSKIDAATNKAVERIERAANKIEETAREVTYE